MGVIKRVVLLTRYYNGGMRSTKLDESVASQVKRPVSTVVRHRTKEGMWPLDGEADFVRHYEVMDALGLGTGKDNWLIALQSADAFEWPTVRLRRDLLAVAELDIEGATIDQSAARQSPVFSLVREFLSGIALGSEDASREPLVSSVNRQTRRIELRESVGDVAEALADDAIDGVWRTATSQSTSPEDFRAFAVIADTVADKVPGIEDGDLLSEVPLEVDVHARVATFPARMTNWLGWARTASPRELVEAVRTTTGIVRAIAGDPGRRLTETDWWRFVGMLTPMFGSERSALEPVVAAILVSVKSNIRRTDSRPPASQ